jgi:hypothetical protein
MLEAFIDAPGRHRDLTVFPVVAPAGPSLHYLLSTEIQGTDVLTVRERGDQVTSMLLAKNNSFHDLLVVAGEPLPGENPGRLVARSFLLGGKSVTQIPASSLERGGWATPHQESTITHWLESFPPHQGQVGLLACLGDRILGMEAFGSEKLYRPLHRRLVIRFIKEALRESGGWGPNGSPPAEGEDDGPLPSASPGTLERKAQTLVSALEEADREEDKQIGLGQYWLLRGPAVGGELIHQGNLVHLSVRSGPPETPTADPQEE